MNFILCPVCSNENIETYKYTPKNYTDIKKNFYVCNKCKCCWQNKENDKIYEINKQVFEDSQMLNIRPNDIKLLCEYIDDKLGLNNKKILDLCCGEGHLVNYINKNYQCDIKGIELISNKHIENNNQFIIEDFNLYDFKDEKFDLIICYVSLNLMSDIKKTLAKCYDLLKENGSVYIKIKSVYYLYQLNKKKFHFTLNNVIWQHDYFLGGDKSYKLLSDTIGFKKCEVVALDYHTKDYLKKTYKNNIVKYLFWYILAKMNIYSYYSIIFQK